MDIARFMEGMAFSFSMLFGTPWVDFLWGLLPFCCISRADGIGDDSTSEKIEAKHIM
jgi:hypothetical protein